MITIVDYGLGNLGSVANMLKRVGVPARISSSAEDVQTATALILPGVGHFDTGMRNIVASGLKPVLDRRVLVDGVPVLGICLGLQLMARRSDEGVEPGLGWLNADVKRFSFPTGASALAVPHMGWNEIEPKDEALYRGLATASRFYFVHSFHLVCDADADVAAWTTYGYRFAASVHKGTLYGTQFHPEKSHRFGMTLLKNFVEAAGAA